MRTEARMQLQTRNTRAKKRAAQQAKRQGSRSHTCGECRACCYAFPLLDKAANCWCKHATPTGCGCYETRPAVCRDYWCGYLTGDSWPPEWRPDRSGVIVTVRGVFREHPVICLTQCWDNAIDTSHGREIMLSLLESPAIVFYSEGVCYSHTGLELDATGQRELLDWIRENSRKKTARIGEDPFDFGGNSSSATDASCGGSSSIRATSEP